MNGSDRENGAVDIDRRVLRLARGDGTHRAFQGVDLPPHQGRRLSGRHPADLARGRVACTRDRRVDRFARQRVQRFRASRSGTPANSIQVNGARAERPYRCRVRGGHPRVYGTRRRCSVHVPRNDATRGRCESCASPMSSKSRATTSGVHSQPPHVTFDGRALDTIPIMVQIFGATVEACPNEDTILREFGGERGAGNRGAECAGGTGRLRLGRQCFIARADRAVDLGGRCVCGAVPLPSERHPAADHGLAVGRDRNVVTVRLRGAPHRRTLSRSNTCASVPRSGGAHWAGRCVTSTPNCGDCRA